MALLWNRQPPVGKENPPSRRLIIEMRRQTLIAVVALLVGSSCSLFERDDTLGEMTLERRGQSGVVRVDHEGETFEVDDRRQVEPGDVIRTSGGAQARLRLGGDREVWLADRTRIELVDTDAVDDEKGTVLADVDDPTTVMFGDVEASVAQGVFRVDQLSASARAGVYAGSAHLDSPGEPRVRVRTYFQAPVAAGEIMPVAPYRIDAADEWDRLWLEEIVALDEELAQLANGFSAQIGRARPTLSYFRGLSDGRDVSAVRPYLRRAVADLMIAYTIADTDGEAPFGASFSRAFRLHDAGAAWGLAVAIMEVKSRPMLAALEELIIGTGAVAGGAGDEFTFATGSPGGGTGPGGSVSGPSPGGDPGVPDAPEGDGGDDGGGPGDDGGEECQNVIECTVQDPPIPLPDPSPDDSIIDDLLP